MMKKVILMSMVLLLAWTVSAEAQKKGFPAKDITNIVVWSAGGGTDVCNRIISAEMSKILGVNINVINKTGGVGGSIGMADAYSKPHDGYTLAAFPNPASRQACRAAGTRE
jgi:tripartite-type tricarboxylate transporter receptor subunit TctC